MPRFRKRVRRLISAPRWPSKDHRLFQTVGCVSAWRSRLRRTAAPAPEGRPRGAPLPALSRIVSVRREDAVLRVELRVERAATLGRPPVLVRDRADATPAEAASERLPDAGAEARTWTVSLLMN